jgi:hypothetical protein
MLVLAFAGGVVVTVPEITHGDVDCVTATVPAIETGCVACQNVPVTATEPVIVVDARVTGTVFVIKALTPCTLTAPGEVP